MPSHSSAHAVLSIRTSASLLECVKARDGIAWGKLVNLYSPMVYRWARKAGLQAHDAHDIVQDVFLAVASDIVTFRRTQPSDSFRGRLWTICRHKILDTFQARQHEVQAAGGSNAHQLLAQITGPDCDFQDLTNEMCRLRHRALVWLREEFEPHVWQAFLDACASCQSRLEQLDKAAENRAAKGGDDLLRDLRRRPPADALETEPECASAAIRAASTANIRSAPTGVSRPPDVSDVEALAHRGHYEVLGVLGHGGMGVVYKARHLKMNRLVAIKVLPPLQPQDSAAVARFEREIKAVARLAHPNIVAAHDADEVDGKHFLVLEYIDGTDLKSLVKSQGPLPVGQAVAFIVQAARGLDYAHAQGIVHRDVKPANLMVDQSGTVKVLDLGLARADARTGAQADLTETGMLLGTVDYLAPEQAAGARDVDGRADIYSLGCSLYYLLTGRQLYDGDTVIEKVLAHRERPIPSLRAACPDAPAGLEKVFARMVAKRPDDRYRTMAQVIVDLEVLLAATTTPAGTPVIVPPTARAWSSSRPGWRSLAGKHRLWWGAIGLVVLGTVGALWFGSAKRRVGPAEGASARKTGEPDKAASVAANRVDDLPADEPSAILLIEKLATRIVRDDTLATKPVILVAFGGGGAGNPKLIRDEHLKVLTGLKHLRTLELQVTSVTDANLWELKALTRLTKLRLGDTQVTDLGLKELKEFKQLVSLDLWHSQVTNRGLKDLKELPQLADLDLGGTQVTDVGLKELEGLPLTRLNLMDTRVTDAGLKELKALARLTELDIRETRTTNSGVADLQRVLPNCQIVR